MSNAKCLNLSHPIVKQNIKDISRQLGLQESTISLNEYKAIVRAFSIYKGIENEDVLDYIGSQEYDDFLNDYFNIGKSIEFSSDLEEKILEFLEQNKEYINTPLEDTTENRMIANGIYIATEEKAQIINLANNKFIVRVNQISEAKTKKELKEIKDNAIANGTFMKAPNGKPTNLTEQQWLHVRTKAFKRWFGDWERVAKSSKYKVSRDIPNSITTAIYEGVYVGEAEFDPDMAPDGGSRVIKLGDKYIGSIPVFEFDDSIHMGGSIGAATEILHEFRGKGYGKKAHLALANIAKAEGKVLYSDSSNSDAEDALWRSLVREGVAEIVEERPKKGNWNHTTYRIINDSLPSAEKISFGDENVSKVIDENGEPLVVYHGSPNKFSEFNTDLGVKKTYTDKSTHFFTDDIEVAKSYGEELYPVFLNITNPVVKDFGGNPWNRYSSPITPEELKKWEEDRKANKNRIKDLQEKIKVLKTNYEASIDENDIFGIGDPVILQEINELENELNMATMLDKTLSTPPTHTYSTTDELIAGIKETFDGAIFKNVTDSATAELVHKIVTDYVVKNPNQIKSATDNIGTYSTELNNIYYNLSSKSITKDLKDKGLIHAFNGELYVTKKGAESLEDVENYFIEKMMRLGYSEDSYNLYRTTSGVRVTINEGSKKADYIESEVNHTFSTIENTIKFLEEKIPALEGKVHYNVTIKEAKEILGNKYSDNVNSFVHNGEIYLIRGRVTQDIAIEEALHILTESLIIDNKALAYELLHEAEKLFPQLVDEIRRTYEGADTQNREILTQALARVFRQEFNEGERQTAESILSKFINWIKQLFGINPTTGNTIIELDDLSTNMTLRDFAQLINSSNAEFRTWSHNKTQFNKSAKGELISSSAKSSAFARQLTNPGNNLTVEYKGHTFRNAEHAYQTWKSGEFDEKAYKSKAFKPVGSKKVNTAVNFDIMVEILTAKLQQHPELIEGINERGGLDYILNSTHEVTGDKYWESSGENKFIEALAKAYEQVSTTSSVKFTTSKKEGYKERTLENADLSDVTIALAADFTTYGETLTAHAAGSRDRKYLEGKNNHKREVRENVADKHLPYKLNKTSNNAKTIASNLFDMMKTKKLPTKNIKINVAGNGIYSLSKSQEYYNDLVTDVIKELQNLGVTISEIRSGGQTGIDEAGIIAAQRLGIPAVVHGTKDWAFRGKDGKDVKGDEAAYKARFNVTTQPTPKAKGKMTFSYGNNKRNDITSTTTFEAIQKGERTATTRYESDGHIDYWKSLKEGDIIEWESKTGEKVLVRVTKPLTKLSKTTKAETWSKKEGWSVEYYNKEVKPRLNEAWQIEYELLNGFNTSSKTTLTTSKNKPTLEDRVAEIENVYKTFKTVVFQGENFKKDHKYTIIEDGEEREVYFSATTLNKALKSKSDLEDFSSIKNEELTPPNGGVYPQRFVGNGFDAVVRKYFNGGINHFDSFENISTGLKKSLLTQLKQLEKHFDSEFGEGKYKVITGFGDDEFVVGGYVSDAEYSYAVAGTLDMIVVTEDGDIYIYDMKTDSHKKGISKDNIQKYQGQLTLYKRFIAENFPELANRIKGIRIISADVRFGDLTAEDIHNGASIEFEAQDDGTLLHNGTPVEEKEGFVTIKINVTKGDNYSLVDLKQSALIEALEIDPLTFEEEKTLEETLASKTTDPITELEKIETANDDSKKFKGSSEYKEFESDDEVDFTEENTFKTLVKPTERVYLGRQIMKTMSDFLNHLHTDDSFRLRLVDITGEPIYEKENYFVEKDRDKILTKELMSEILEYIKEEYFNYKDMEVDDPEFEKTRWIHNNFTALVNGAFAELIELEGVSLVGGEVVQVGQEDNPVTNEDLSYREENAKQAYDISNRNTSVIASMNQTVKRELSLIHDYEYKEDGTISTVEINGEDFPLYNTDKDFDIPKFLDKDVVITTIQKIVYSKKKVSGMIKALKAERANYPWLEQVISKLEANKDNYQSKFFNTFYKSRTNYIKVYKEEEGFGADKQVTYIHADLRDSAKRDAILDKLNKKLFAEIEEELPPIFTKEEDNNAPGLVSVDRIQLEIFKEALKDLQGKKKKARETADEKAERIKKGLSDVFEILGIDEDVSLNYILDSKNKNRLNSLIDNFKALEKAFIARSTKKEAVIAEDITNPYYGISETLAYFLKDHVEISYYDNGDNWMVFTQPTYIQTLIEKLKGAEVEEGISYEESLGNLMKYDQFVSVGEEGSRVFVSKWLEELVNIPNSREIINHFVRTSIDNKKHFKQSTSEYLLGMLINFAAPTATNSKYDVPKDVAMYRMPIMSDKPAGDMLLFKKYGGVDLNNPKNNYNLDYMKEQIADMSFNFFKLEVNRMRAIREQLVEQVNSDVEFYHIPRTKDKKAQWVTKDSKGKVVPIQFSHKKFIETRGLRGFNGFKFHYCPMFNAEMDNNTEVAQLILDIINSSDENIIAEKFDALQERFTDIFIAGKEAEYQTFITNYASKLNKKALFNSIPQIGSEKQYDAFMQDFFWNDSFATMNIYNLTIIDPAFYKNTIDLQKRYAQMHASTSKVNTEAKFAFDGVHQERVSDGKTRVIYISDLEAVSELSKTITSLFTKLANEEKDPTRKLELQILAQDLASQYKSIDVTDGQSYGTLTSFWKKLYMLGEDTPALNKAILDLKGSLKKIEDGEFSLENYDLCLQAFKPFVYSQIEHPNDTKALGKYLCPTQIKNSEALIHLGMSILKGLKTKGFTDSSHILAGIMEVVEKTHWNDGKYKHDGIDTIVFHSAVKNGDFAEINLNDCTSKEQVVARLEQAIYEKETDDKEKEKEKTKKKRDYTVNKYDSKFVKEYSFLEWGKQQEVPGHMQDHEQDEGSQNRIIVVSDLPEDFVLKVGNKTYKKSEKGSARAQLLERYFELIAEEMLDGVSSVREELQLDSENKADKYKAISRYIVNSIVKDAKYTDEMRKAFTALENGDFLGAVGDPSIADKLFSATFSLIKKNVNSQKFPGGPVVVTSVYGSEDLGIAFDNPKTQEGMHYQIMITCPTEDLERRITVNTKKINSQMKKAGVKNLSRQYVDGELFDVVDALALGLITEDETLVECQRIPTEDKYSIFRCRVIKFLPRQIGERFVGPKEITKISGMDMDIDKVFTKFKYNLRSLEKKEKEGTLKPKEEKLLKTRRRRNEIFDIQYAVLGHPMSYANTLNTGNFKPLKDLADKVDKSRGAEHSLMNISGQLYFFEQNGGGKEYVGIAALNNIAHHICNIAELSFTEFPYFTINGRHSFNRENDELTTGNYRFDRTYSIFDDSRISRTIGMFVGASADNAKEAVLASINIIPTTATLAKGLLRMGIPLDTVVYMLNHPAVKNATRIALEANTVSAFTSALAEALKEAQENSKYKKSVETLIANTNFLNEDLYERTQSNKILEKDKLFDVRVLGFLNMMMPYCQAIADVSIVTSLNSTKNAVGPRVLDTLKRQLKIQRLFDDVRSGRSLISDSLLNIYNKIPYLKVLEECFSKLMPEICGDLSPIYAPDFLKLISILERNGLDVVYMEEKDFNKLVNSWLLYKASGEKGILDSSFENRRKMIYDFPLRFIQAQRNGSLDNEFIKSLNTPTTMNKRNKILNITFSSIGKSRGTRSDLAASWEELATSDNLARKELSNDLMTYMMFRFGWSFSPKSAMNIAPNKAKEAYPNYKEIFSTTDEFNTADMMNFLYQYARNNWYGKMWVNPHLEKDEGMFKTINGKFYYIVKDAERLTGLNFLKLGKNRYIRVNEVSFVKVERLGIENNFFEFDGSSNNGIFMKSVIDKSSTNKQKKDYTGLQVEDNTIEDFDDENDDDNSGVINSPFNSPETTMPEYISHKELKALLDNKKVLKAIEEKGFKASFNKEVKAGNVDIVYEMLEKIAKAMTTTLSEEEIQKSYKNILKKFKEDHLC